MQWVTLLRACLIVGGRPQVGEVGFKDKKRKRGTNVLNKTAEKVLKKLGTKEETRDKVAVTTVSKLSLDQDHKKQSFEMPEMAKKKNLYSVRQATFSSSRICKEVQKPYCG